MVCVDDVEFWNSGETKDEFSTERLDLAIVVTIFTRLQVLNSTVFGDRYIIVRDRCDENCPTAITDLRTRVHFGCRKYSGNQKGYFDTDFSIIVGHTAQPLSYLL